MCVYFLHLHACDIYVHVFTSLYLEIAIKCARKLAWFARKDG